MSNNRDDFLPEVRNKGWWATDSRMAVSGKAVEIILQKQGKMPVPDLSDIEAVQMGHVLQPIIGQLVTSKLGLEIKDADYALTHDKEAWLKSHFDFITADGNILIEAKNYNASKRNQFDPETARVPHADYIQCLHEATVHNVDKVILAVLFGGQEFQTFELFFENAEKEQFIKDMSVYWAYIINGNTPQPETIEQTKLVYPESRETVLTATEQLEIGISELKALKRQIKELEEVTEQYEVQIRNAMGSNAEIRTFDGNTLATWKSSKPSKRFSPDLFKSAMPDIYDQFCVEMPGSRRFLIK